ncbi:alanine/ornithine racemase family PLP-dependent enzyme [Acetonema longum]|uniref:Alanine racemase domain protein n=1 Tax=Acetonema longum DSM 6540 TaxID=1009370 RepID=F7NI01_9FIRM|nr:alanine/ornithine racemase family PLP-dependent enzyme [Acetonema longum]EGO64308.1 alanine racemase domain protein [Acetonema longum DSM 6540]
MGYPFVEIQLDRVAANTRLIVDMCRARSIEVVGVTKGVCADVAIAQAMLDGGVAMLGDARVQNLRRLREAGVNVPLMLLRIPMPSEADEVVRVANCSLVSEFSTLSQLNQAAGKAGVAHDVILMVDMGDLREGVMPQKILPLVQRCMTLQGIRLQGLGANFACYGGLIPTPEILSNLVALNRQIRDAFAVTLPVVSGGSSANLGLLMAGALPAGITQLRIGEGILLGRESLRRNAIPGAYQNALNLCAEVVEVQEKPSVPLGEIAQDAFGQTPVFVDRGTRKRAIAAIGRQDVELTGLTPACPGIDILGGSSDHLILDVSDAATEIVVGSKVCFYMQYGALVHAMISPYVSRVYTGRALLHPAKSDTKGS